MASIDKKFCLTVNYAVRTCVVIEMVQFKLVVDATEPFTYVDITDAFKGHLSLASDSNLVLPSWAKHETNSSSSGEFLWRLNRDLVRLK